MGEEADRRAPAALVDPEAAEDGYPGCGESCPSHASFVAMCAFDWSCIAKQLARKWLQHFLDSRGGSEDSIFDCILLYTSQTAISAL